MKDTKLNLRISEDIKNKLDFIAQEKQVTVSDIIRGLIDSEINNCMGIDFDKKLLTLKMEDIKSILDDLEQEKDKFVMVSNSNDKQLCVVDFDTYEISIKSYELKDEPIKETEFIELNLFKSEIMVAKYFITKNSKIQISNYKKALNIIY